MTSLQECETSRSRRKTGAATTTGVERIIDLVKNDAGRRYMDRRMPNAASCGGWACDVPRQILWRTQIITGIEAVFSVASRGLMPLG